MGDSQQVPQSQLPPLQQFKNSINAASQSLAAIQQLRSTVTNVFKLLSEGHVEKEANEKNAKNIFLQKFQDLLHSVNKDFTELEEIGSNIVTTVPDLTLPLLGSSGNLSLDGSVDEQSLYHNLILTYHWQTKLHLHAQYTNILLNQSAFKRSSINHRRRRMGAVSHPQQNKLYTKANSQMLDGFIQQLARVYPDLQMKPYNLYNSTKILRLTLEKVFVCYILLKGLIIERVVVFGLDESYTLEKNKPDLFANSRYECMRRITDNATAAYLQYDWMPNQSPDYPIKQFLAWMQSYKTLFTEPCKKCGKILDKGIPPTWRDYKSQHLPYHDACKL